VEIQAYGALYHKPHNLLGIAGILLAPVPVHVRILEFGMFHHRSIFFKSVSRSLLISCYNSKLSAAGRDVLRLIPAIHRYSGFKEAKRSRAGNTGTGPEHHATTIDSPDCIMQES